jgi:dihydropteroate synthase
MLIHYHYGQIIPNLIIRGNDPDRLINAAIRNNLISKLQHAYYLGKELEKAKIALETGKSYVQDFRLRFGTD